MLVFPPSPYFFPFPQYSILLTDWLINFPFLNIIITYYLLALNYILLPMAMEDEGISITTLLYTSYHPFFFDFISYIITVLFRLIRATFCSIIIYTFVLVLVLPIIDIFFHFMISCKKFPRPSTILILPAANISV